MLTVASNREDPEPASLAALMPQVSSEGDCAVPPTVVPPVVAVVVTRDPGPWFDATMASLVEQDYGDLSILVLDAGSAEDPTARVAAVAPRAFVRRLDRDEGYGASANHVLQMVEGASLYLFCHDDVALDPDAVHLLVEEAYRSNSGVVAPKQVGWYDDRRLLHVGLAVDKGGAVVDRVHASELDHGQHDAVRDIFVAPGGCMLVRADLFVELGGFDTAIVLMGEDLDLCWRAQVLGARVVLAPAARVRHLERLASGARPVPPSAGAGVSLQELQRRHELYVVLKAYSRPQLVRIVPQVLALAVAEVVVALATGHRQRATAVLHAWHWNLTHRSAIRRGRRLLEAGRRVPDAPIRAMQVRGSARLTTYARRAATHGLQRAHLDVEMLGAHDLPDGAGALGDRPALAADACAGASPDAPAGSAGSDLRRIGVVSLANGDVPEFCTGEEGRRSAPEALGPAVSEAKQSLALRFTLWAVVVVAVVYGSRSLLTSGFPVTAQILPIPSWASLWHGLFSNWDATGVGTTVISNAGYGLLAVLSTALFGAVGLMQTVVLLGCLPVGAWGVSRLLRATGSSRARIVGTVVYLALPVAYNDLAAGRWQAILAYAAVPWVLGILARSAGVEPLGPKPAGDSPAPDRRPWRSGLFGAMVTLGLFDAVFGALDPQGLAITVVVAAGLAIGTLAAGGSDSVRAALRTVTVAVGATVAALILLAPWSIGVLGNPARWTVLFGVRIPASGGSGIADLLRLSAGPVGDTPLAYAFVVAGLVPLLIGSRWRLAWATRVWALALVAWVLAWAGGRGWLGPLALPAGTLLAPAGLAMALAAGLGVAALETDLQRYRFARHRGLLAVAAVVAVVGLLPVLGAVASGRWDMPVEGWGQATAFMGQGASRGGYRVLWLGDPTVLPGPSWSVEPGLAGELTEGPVPTLAADLTVPARHPLHRLVVALRQAQEGDTVELGRALAPYAIRYVMVTESLAPTVLGYTSDIPAPVPAGLVAAMGRQIDLRAVSTESGYEVFSDPGWLPERAVSTVPSRPSTVGATRTTWRGVLPGVESASAFEGRVPAGTLRLAYTPSSRLVVDGPDGRALDRTSPHGALAATYVVPRTERVTVEYGGSSASAAAIAVVIVLWLTTIALLAGRRRWLDWWWSPLGRRLHIHGGPVPPGGGASEEPVTGHGLATLEPAGDVDAPVPS